MTGKIVPTGKRRKEPKADKDHTSESFLADSQPLLKQHEENLPKIKRLIR